MKKTLIAIFLFCLLANSNSHAELQLGITIPTRTITVDGQVSDWADIDPIVLDDTADSSCGTFTDITYSFLAKDDEHLYWRIDMSSGNYDSYDYPPMIRFLSHTPDSESKDGDIEAGVREDTGRIDIYSESIHEWNRPLEGIAYGAIGEIAEGKIPLSLFENQSFTFAETYSHNAVIGGTTCDRVELSQRSADDDGSGSGGTDGDGGSSGGGCFISILYSP